MDQGREQVQRTGKGPAVLQVEMDLVQGVAGLVPRGDEQVRGHDELPVDHPPQVRARLLLEIRHHPGDHVAEDLHMLAVAGGEQHVHRFPGQMGQGGDLQRGPGVAEVEVQPQPAVLPLQRLPQHRPLEDLRRAAVKDPIGPDQPLEVRPGVGDRGDRVRRRHDLRLPRARSPAPADRSDLAANGRRSPCPASIRPERQGTGALTMARGTGMCSIPPRAIPSVQDRTGPGPNCEHE